MNASLQQKMRSYYTRYYRDECCLPNWQKNVEARLLEEEDELVKMKELEHLLGTSFNGQKHCIIGAGTGGLAVVLKQHFDVDVYGVEPSDEEFDIILDRAREAGIPEDHFHKIGGEHTPFENNFFDVIHCFTVLEHVQDVQQCLDEMLRIVKPGCKVYINTPNYAYPYERHYKIPFPTFLPKVFGKLYLLALRKSPAFLNTVNYITEKSINKMLIGKSGFVWFRLYRTKQKNTGFLSGFFNYLLFSRFVYSNQEIILLKNESTK